MTYPSRKIASNISKKLTTVIKDFFQLTVLESVERAQDNILNIVPDSKC